MGYKDEVKGYKLWNLVTRNIVYSQDVISREVKGTSRIEYVTRENKLEKPKSKLNNEECDWND